MFLQALFVVSGNNSSLLEQTQLLHVLGAPPLRSRPILSVEWTTWICSCPIIIIISIVVTILFTIACEPGRDLPSNGINSQFFSSFTRVEKKTSM